MQSQKKSRRLSRIVCWASVFFISVTFEYLLNEWRYNTCGNNQLNIPESCLKNGYLICRQGDGLWSQLIISHNITDKRFSHIGILSISEGNVSVIHADTSNRFAVSGKVIQEPLNSFISHSRRIGIYKHKRVDAIKIEANAHHYLGRPFDWIFNDRDGDAVYCSELLKMVIEEISVDEIFVRIKCGDKEIIPVDAFIIPEHCEEVYLWCDNEKKITSFEFIYSTLCFP